MAKGKSTDKRPARSRYKSSFAGDRNRKRKMERDAKQKTFFSERNRLVSTLKVGKADARRIIRLMKSEGLVEQEAKVRVLAVAGKGK